MGGHGFEAFRYLTYEIHNVSFAQVEFYATVFQFAEVQQLVHHIQKVVGIALHETQLFFLCRILHGGQQFLKRTQDEGEGSPEFVAHIGVELRLHTVHFLVVTHLLTHLGHAFLGSDTDQRPTPHQGKEGKA